MNLCVNVLKVCFPSVNRLYKFQQISNINLYNIIRSAKNYRPVFCRTNGDQFNQSISFNETNINVDLGPCCNSRSWDRRMAELITSKKRKLHC